jgi:hypothetical protein
VYDQLIQVRWLKKTPLLSLVLARTIWAMRGNFSGFTALNVQAANEASLFADQVDTLVGEPMHKYLLNQLRAARR